MVGKKFNNATIPESYEPKVGDVFLFYKDGEFYGKCSIIDEITYHKNDRYFGLDLPSGYIQDVKRQDLIAIVKRGYTEKGGSYVLAPYSQTPLYNILRGGADE